MRPRVALALVAVLALAGCHRKEITSLERKEGASLSSEADFAVTMKEWSRAEDLFAKAVKLCPDQGDTWLNLAVVRMRLKNPDGARSAYKSALAAYQDDMDRNPNNTMSVLRKAYVLVILGRADEARSLASKSLSKHPDDRTLKGFVEGNGVDKMIADPRLKEISP